MNKRISIGEVKDLGGGKFSVRLHLDSANPEAALSQTQTVSAEGYDAAVQIAMAAFSRWLTLIEHTVKNANWCNHRPN
jgi:hypothetical protein